MTEEVIACDHQWFPYWVDRSKYVIEWYCHWCKSWTGDPTRDSGPCKC